MSIKLSVVFIWGLSVIANAYQWPSPALDALDETLYERHFLTEFVVVCNTRTSNATYFDNPKAMSSIAAEWLRFAYHDAATHNITDGTGGLDGSVMYELDRAENIGDSLKKNIIDFSHLPSKYLSFADLIAMAAVWGVAGCRGPVIPFRGGRLDAFKAGPPGVPEPHQDLQSHIERFRLQGFTQMEMIQMVACGHSMGGVHSEDFPGVDSAANATRGDIMTFDSTPAFDKIGVSDYLNGTTKDPLVRSPNTTMNSDLRVFASDGNVTIRSLNTDEAFRDTCSSILSRMLNTVPKGVELFDVPLIPVKVKVARLDIYDGALRFGSILRMAMNSTMSVENIKVRMFWCDRRGEFADCKGKGNVVSIGSDSGRQVGGSPITTGMGYRLAQFSFAVPIQANRSISKFWFEIDQGYGPVIHSNGGKGYIYAQDEIVFASGATEKLNPVSPRPPPGTPRNLTIIAGIRKGSPPASFVAKAFDRTSGIDDKPPSGVLNVMVPFSLNSSKKLAEGYDYYSAVVTSDRQRLSVDLEVVINGITYVEDFIKLQTLIPDASVPQIPIGGANVTTFAPGTGGTVPS